MENIVNMQGTVLAGTNNYFEIECDDGVVRTCSIKGKVLKSEKEYYNPLAPGDIVEIEKDSIDEDKGQIISLVPRKNEFVRWNVKGRCPQLLAAMASTSSAVRCFSCIIREEFLSVVSIILSRRGCPFSPAMNTECMPLPGTAPSVRAVP